MDMEKKLKERVQRNFLKEINANCFDTAEFINSNCFDSIKFINNDNIESLVKNVLTVIDYLISPSDYNIDIVNISNRYGYKVIEGKLESGYEDVSGFINNDEKCIVVNIKDNPKTKIFTIAHLLGHYFLDHENIVIDYKNYMTNQTTQDIEANKFASCILIPKEKIKRIVEENGKNLNLSLLSSFFDVPEYAIAMRLVDLGLL